MNDIQFPQPPPEGCISPTPLHPPDLAGLFDYPESQSEGRLAPRLRELAGIGDPRGLLISSAVAYYQATISVPPSRPDFALALADLAITGYRSFSMFRSILPRDDDDFRSAVRDRLESLRLPVDDVQLRSSVRHVLVRAYSVLWALRAPSPHQRQMFRDGLGWIAVSAEDDFPHRPVNAPSAPYAQYDLDVNCRDIPYPFRIRYMIALAPPDFGGRPGDDSWTELPYAELGPLDIGEIVNHSLIPEDPPPKIPPGYDVILFIHGHSSRLEECLELVPQLQRCGWNGGRGRRYAIVAFDFPSNGYSSMIDHTDIAPSSATHWNYPPSRVTRRAGGILGFIGGTIVGFLVGGPVGALIGGVAGAIGGAALGAHLGSAHPGPPTYPLVDFLEDFIISFVDALDLKVATVSGTGVKNRLVAVIGGSLGGCMGLRLGRRTDVIWLRGKKIVAWSPASVWTSFNSDAIKTHAVEEGNNRWDEEETSTSRREYFHQAFDSPHFPPPLDDIAHHIIPPQPQMWYRDGWPCKAAYITSSRLERQEIYNRFFRRWHWRIGTELLLFSHHNTDTPSGRPRYEEITIDALLAAGGQDNYPFTGIYSASIELAHLMVNNHGRARFYSNSGHSIHAEYPSELAQQIMSFLNP